MASNGAINYYWQVRRCLVTVRRHRLEYSLAASLEPAATCLRCRLQHHASLTPSACVRTRTEPLKLLHRLASSVFSSASSACFVFRLLLLDSFSLLSSLVELRRANESKRRCCSPFILFGGVSGVSGVQIELELNINIGWLWGLFLTGCSSDALQKFQLPIIVSITASSAKF